MKKCVFDGAPITRVSATQWKCGGCGLPYGAVLMTDKDVWKEFRRRALPVIESLRDDNTDADIRPLLGVVLTAVLKEMAESE